MFNHQKDIYYLKQDIIKMLDNVSEEEIKLAYRVLRGILD